MKRTMFTLFCIATIAATMFRGAAFAEEKTYINGIDPKYPPFTFTDKSGKLEGFDIDSINWIAKQMGFKVVHQPIKWDEVIPILKSKKIDMVASGMSIDEPRKKEVNFSTVYYKTVMVMVAKENCSVMPDKTMEPNVKWGVQQGTPEAHWIQDNLIEDKGMTFKLMPFDSAPTIMQNIMNGNIDIAAISRSTADEFLHKGMSIKIIGRYGQPDDLTAYAVRKDDPQLLATLNEGLKRLMASPYWNELKAKYNLIQ